MAENPSNAYVLAVVAHEVAHEVQARMLGGYDKLVDATKTKAKLWGPAPPAITCVDSLRILPPPPELVRPGERAIWGRPIA